MVGLGAATHAALISQTIAMRVGLSARSARREARFLLHFLQTSLDWLVVLRRSPKKPLG